MASGGRNKGGVPGMRKNAIPQNSAPHPGESPKGDREFKELTDDEQRDTLNHELRMWDFMGMNVAAVPHNIFNIDAQLLAIVRYIINDNEEVEAELNRRYREVAYEKLTQIRAEATKAQNPLIVPGQGPVI